MSTASDAVSPGRGQAVTHIRHWTGVRLVCTLRATHRALPRTPATPSHIAEQYTLQRVCPCPLILCVLPACMAPLVWRTGGQARHNASPSSRAGHPAGGKGQAGNAYEPWLSPFGMQSARYLRTSRPHLKKLYETLGVDKKASASEIKKAYYSLASGTPLRIQPVCAPHFFSAANSPF